MKTGSCMKIIIASVLLSGASFTSIASAQSGKNVVANDAKSSAIKFGKRLDVWQARLSPDGQKIVVVGAGAGRTSVVSWAPISGGAMKQVTASNGSPENIGGCDFSANDRLVCRLSGLFKEDRRVIGFNRLLSFDLDGKNVKILGQRQRSTDARIRQGGENVIEWNYGQDATVLMTKDYVPDLDPRKKFRNNDNGLGVVALNTRTNKSKRVERPSQYISRYYSDGAGNIRLARFNVNDSKRGFSSGEVKFSYREKDGKNWIDFGRYDGNTDEGFYPLSVDGKNNRVFGLENKDGRDALYTVDLDTELTKKLIFAHPKVDVGGTVRFGEGGRVVGVSYAVDKPEVLYFDKGLAKLARQLSKALPHLPIIRFIDASQDETVLLIHARSDDDPGRYFVFNRTAKSLNEIILSRGLLEKTKLSKVTPVSYKAADGTNIPGYLTLPPGVTKEAAKGLPAIVMPHGGPASRDVWGFDWIAQFLANQGYAVLQPNYRASDGYGDDWFVENGFKSWKIAIGDINDGGRWLVKEGIADPNKMGILGWSYGGYAALQSAVVDQDLFKAVVAIAPVTDFADTITESRGFTNYKLVQKQIGSGPHIKEGSPLQNVSKISVPVALFHGDMDANVGVRQSRLLAKALKSAGKPVEYQEYKGLDHQLPDSNIRANMLYLTAQFLEKHLQK